jgi:hypothetical protein
MSCELVEALAADLARGTLDPGPRATVLDHASRCPHCSARLASERALSSGLAALAAATEAESAPTRLESALQSAFERRSASAVSTGEPAANTRHDTRGRGTGARSASVAFWLAAAAAVVVALGVFVSVRRPIAPYARSVASPSPASPDEPARFVLLGYGESLDELDSMHVVRVQLAASTLTDLGWVPQVGLDSGAVTADVVVGPDGIARAIRVVEGPEREDEGGEGS